MDNESAKNQTKKLGSKSKRKFRLDEKSDKKHLTQDIGH